VFRLIFCLGVSVNVIGDKDAVEVRAAAESRQAHIENE
jgi:hypothetical protein